MKVVFIGLVLGFFAPGFSARPEQVAFTQNQVQPHQSIPGNCEDNILILSNAHHAAGPDGNIIAISRLGTGERIREISQRRLHNVRIYLTEYGWHRPSATVITAEGDKIKGFGRVELYVKGVLFTVLAVRRNQDLLVGSCEPDDIRPVRAERNLYPYLDQKRRKPARKP